MDDEVARLTPRQRLVIACVAEGLSNREIANRLRLAEGTISNHLETIRRRLHLRNRVQIAVWAVEHGLYRSKQSGP
jgi:two-component system, NarL family, nitrate/nitrite response regulator NarL